MILHASQKRCVLSLLTILRLLFRMLLITGLKYTIPSTPSSFHLGSPTKKRCDGACDHSKNLESHSAKATTLSVSRKLLVVENVVVLAQSKRGDADSLEHVLVELSAPVHQRCGEH